MGTEQTPTLRVIAVDDDPVLLEQLERAFGSHPSIAAFRTAEGAAQALKELKRFTADIALVDVSMPGVGGLELAEAIRAAHPDVRVVMFTGDSTADTLSDAIAAGAKGYLLKDLPTNEIVAALLRAQRGERVMGSRIIDMLLQSFQENRRDIDPEFRARLEAAPDSLQRIMGPLMRGRSNAQVAAELHLSAQSVPTYVSRLMKEVGCDSRLDLVARAAACGYEPPDPESFDSLGDLGDLEL